MSKRTYRFNEIFTAFGVITAANSTKSVLKLTVNYQNLFLFFRLISPTGIFSQPRKHSNYSRVKYGTLIHSSLHISGVELISFYKKPYAFTNANIV